MRTSIGSIRERAGTRTVAPAQVTDREGKTRYHYSLATALGLIENYAAAREAKAREEERERLKSLAEEHFDARSKLAREGKASAIEAGDASVAECFSCELKALDDGFGCWLMALHQIKEAPDA